MDLLKTQSEMSEVDNDNDGCESDSSDSHVYTESTQNVEIGMNFNLPKLFSKFGFLVFKHQVVVDYNLFSEQIRPL